MFSVKNVTNRSKKMFGFLLTYSVITVHFSLVVLFFFFDVDNVNNSDRTAEV